MTKSATSSTSAMSGTSTLVGSARSVLDKKKPYKLFARTEAEKQWDALFEDDDNNPDTEVQILVPETPPRTPTKAPRASPPSPVIDRFVVPETPRRQGSSSTSRPSSQRAARTALAGSDEDEMRGLTESSVPAGGSDKENQPIPPTANAEESSSDDSDGWSEPFMGASEPDNQVEATDSEVGSGNGMDLDSFQMAIDGAENDLMDVEQSPALHTVNLETTFANFGIDASHVSAELTNAVEDGYPLRLFSEFGRNYLSSGSAAPSTSKPLLFGRSLMDRDRLLRMSIPSIFFATPTTSPSETVRTIGRVSAPVPIRADSPDDEVPLARPQQLLILWSDLVRF